MAYDDFTPDELLTKAIRKELPMWKVNLHLQLREKRYAQFDFGTDPNYEGAIPLEEWSKKYAAVANTLKKIEILQRPTPPCVKFDCTSTMEKLREIRDECITGERDRDVALAVFDKRVQDCKNDLLSVVEHSVTKTYGFIFELTQTETLIHEYAEKVIEGGWNKAMASFDVIRAEIEALPKPAPDTQPPEETQAAVTDVEIEALPEAVPVFLQAWIEAGQVIRTDNGEYLTSGSPQDFCFWLGTKQAKDIPPPKTTQKTLANPVSLETWKRYYRDAGINKSTMRG